VCVSAADVFMVSSAWLTKDEITMKYNHVTLIEYCEGKEGNDCKLNRTTELTHISVVF